MIVKEHSEKFDLLRRLNPQISLLSTIEDCEDELLTQSGVTLVFKKNKPKLNDFGRDFYLRYCDQKIAGGGWTVNLGFTKFLYWDSFTSIL